MFNTFLYQPLFKILIFLTGILGGSFGLAIIALTLIIRTALIPLTLPSIRSAQKMKDLKPRLDELKKKHSKDKRRLQQEQLNLYKEHGVNPAAGCLPTIVQFLILIALYRVFIDFIQNGGVDSLVTNMQFLWLDLSKPDPLYILPLMAGGTQLLLSQMLMTGKERHEVEDLRKKAREKEKKLQKGSDEGGTLEMAETLQQQMLYVMPVMTALIALRFPSGLALYWVATTLFSLVQQYIVSGPGGLTAIFEKLQFAKKYER
jgi:YidC/Oxa1 family membrane protein insertase